MKKTYQKPAIKIRELSYETAVLQASGIPQFSNSPADNSQNLSKRRDIIWEDDNRSESIWKDDYGY